MSTPEVSFDPLLNPALFARLAADLAGFDITEPTSNAASDSNDSDFVLEFDIRAGLKLLLTHESEGPRFIVSCVALDLTDDSALWSLALRMNHHLPAGMRFSIDETQDHSLHLTQVLDANTVTLTTLALAVTDASEVMQLILTPDLMAETGTDSPELGSLLPSHMIKG